MTSGLSFVFEVFIPLTISATSPGFLPEETNILFLPGVLPKKATRLVESDKKTN